MINIEAVNERFYIYGRDATGKRTFEVVKTFKPYFYVEDNSGMYRSIDGKRLRKVVLNNPKNVRGARENYDKTYEADVLYINRYMIDNFKEIPYEPYRACFLDIEVDDSNGFPSVERDEILSIAVYDNFSQKYYAFVSGDGEQKCIEFENSKAYICHFANECELLKGFITFVRKMDFDIVLGWNAEQFDYPYIMGRIKANKLKVSDLSPMDDVNDRTNLPRGRTWLDLMWMYRKVSTHELESMRLDFIANEELGRGKIERGKCIDLWRDEHDKFIHYNLNDVYLMVAIEGKRKHRGR